MRLLRIAGVAVFFLLAAGVGYWAGRVALQPPPDPLENIEETATYVVDTGKVGRSLSFTAVAEWLVEPAGHHSGSGVVTSVEVAPGEAVDAGDLLYSVGLRPVVAAEGKVPMFRPLGLRAEGADVAQMQRMLSSLGFFQGEPDGVFGRSTRDAVRDWQTTLGLDDTGVVELGDVVFIESLPARVVFPETVIPGARIADGEVVVSVVPSEPEFAIPLAPEQADLVPLSADVLVSYADGTWDARIDRAVETETGQLELILTSPTGGSVCGEQCVDWTDLIGVTNFRAEIVVIPETTGPVAPVGALTTNAANEPAVTLPDGTLIPVTVVEAANGIAVVEGIDIGTEILLFSDE